MKKLSKIYGIVLAVTVLAGLCPGISLADEVSETPAASGEQKTEEQIREEENQKKLEAAYNLPVQSNEVKGWVKGPGTYGDAAIVMDAESGAVLYAKNIDKREFPASITKVLTALLAFQYTDMTDIVDITAHSLECLGSGYASIGMKEGNKITMEQALYATLLASSNEVACAVGEAAAAKQGKDYAWFIEEMNRKCKELGGEHSNFVNTNGVHNENHYTCARDMALIGKELFQHPEFFTISQTQQYTIPASETTEEHIFQQKHEMLLNTDKNYYQYAIGGKTGYTTEAGNTLITMADNGDKKLICVVMQTFPGHVYSDTQELLEYGFRNFEKVPVDELEDAEDFDYIEESHVMLPKDVKAKDVKQKVAFKEVNGRDGTVEFTYGGMPVGSAEVTVSKEYVEKHKASFGKNSSSGSDKPERKDGLPLWIKLMLIIAVAGTAAAAVRTAIVREQRRRSRRTKRRGKRPRNR